MARIDASDPIMQVNTDELIGLISSEIYPIPDAELANLQLLQNVQQQANFSVIAGSANILGTANADLASLHSQTMPEDLRHHEPGSQAMSLNR